MPRLPISSAAATTLTLNGKKVVSFGGCNYLGLSFDPSVQAAMIDGLRQFGISTSASRQTTGNTLAHDRLEVALREFLGADDAIVVPDGYTANLAAAQALAATHRAAVIDSRCHRSIREAIAGTGATLVEFEHLNASQAALKLAVLDKGMRASLWTDGVFASDGSVAPLPELLAAARKFGATLVVDDCHGFCTLGENGRGTVSHFGLPSPLPPDVIITSTLAKGLGCHGGVICGTRNLIERIRNGSVAYICTTPTSPAIAAAAIAALSVIQRESARVERLRQNAFLLRSGLRSLGVQIPDSPTPICAFTLGTRPQMEHLCAEMLSRGFLAPLIDYPNGPAPCYFRLSVTSEHTPELIESFVRATAECLQGVVPDLHIPAPRPELRSTIV